MLDFYAERSPIFMAAVFDGSAAAERGQQVGDGTPVHLTIPTTNPWVPLRILGLGKQADDSIQADVYLLTDDEPALLPFDDPGLALAHSKRANDLLLDDLRSDEGMGWVPTSRVADKARDRFVRRRPEVRPRRRCKRTGSAVGARRRPGTAGAAAAGERRRVLAAGRADDCGTRGRACCSSS